MTASSSGTVLPPWRSVLAVVAHPDDESFGLGAILSAFEEAGASTSVLCLTHGEASTIHGVEGDLASVRSLELVAAADALGVGTVRLLAFPDGGLAQTAIPDVSALVAQMAADVHAEGLLVFDTGGVTGHADHVHATAAAVAAAVDLGIGVLAWTIPDDVARVLDEEFQTSFIGTPAEAIDLVIPVDRERQRHAVACHPSQAVPGSVLWRRLELLGGREHLRWLTSDVLSMPRVMNGGGHVST